MNNKKFWLDLLSKNDTALASVIMLSERFIKSELSETEQIAVNEKRKWLYEESKETPSTEKTVSKYPTLEKMNEVKEQSELLSQFLDFIMNSYVLFDPKVPRELPYYDGHGDYIDKEKLLAKFFGIDLEQAEWERDRLILSVYNQTDD